MGLLVYLFLSMPVHLFLHVFLKYIYVYVNKYINSYVCLLFINVSFISTITCPISIHLYNYTNEAFIYISVLLHYNCKINANIQDVYHRPNLQRARKGRLPLV